MYAEAVRFSIVGLIPNHVQNNTPVKSPVQNKFMKRAAIKRVIFLVLKVSFWGTFIFDLSFTMLTRLVLNLNVLMSYSWIKFLRTVLLTPDSHQQQ